MRLFAAGVCVCVYTRKSMDEIICLYFIFSLII